MYCIFQYNLVLYIFKFPLTFSFLPMNYLEVCYLTTYLEIFISIMVKEHMLLDVNSCQFIEIYYMVRDMVCFGEWFTGT